MQSNMQIAWLNKVMRTERITHNHALNDHRLAAGELYVPIQTTRHLKLCLNFKTDISMAVQHAIILGISRKSSGWNRVDKKTFIYGNMTGYGTPQRTVLIQRYQIVTVQSCSPTWMDFHVPLHYVCVWLSCWDSCCSHRHLYHDVLPVRECKAAKIIFPLIFYWFEWELFH